MRNLLKNIFFVFVLSLMYSCGTLGHITFYNFSNPKTDIENNLLSVINKDSIYTPPLQWNGYELGKDTIYDIFVYFKDAPQEIYLIRFTNKENWEHTNYSKLGLVGLFDGKLWHFEKDLCSDEEARVMKRFEEEILSKIKYPYTKSN